MLNKLLKSATLAFALLSQISIAWNPHPQYQAPNGGYTYIKYFDQGLNAQTGLRNPPILAGIYAGVGQLSPNDFVTLASQLMNDIIVAHQAWNQQNPHNMEYTIPRGVSIYNNQDGSLVIAGIGANTHSEMNVAIICNQFHLRYWGGLMTTLYGTVGGNADAVMIPACGTRSNDINCTGALLQSHITDIANYPVFYAPSRNINGRVIMYNGQIVRSNQRMMF